VSNVSTITPKTFGPYEVIATLGRGGNATVYKVCHKPTGQIAALKLGNSNIEWDQADLERFHQEFTAIRPLRHPNVVRAIALGEQDEVPYLVQEFVPGQNLEERLKEKGSLSTEETVALFLQVAEGLKFLHGNDIVHRDIKPSNIFLTPNNQAKLGDFGSLKNLGGDIHLTRSRQGMGTIEYGAPEQFEDAKHADRRCDLYSLAATFYKALTGKFPFGNSGQLQLMQRKLLNHFAPLRLLLPALDPAIDRLINRCLQYDPGQRPSDCDEVIAVLRTSAVPLACCAGSAPEMNSPRVKPTTGPERRESTRLAVDLAATFVPFHEVVRGRWEAKILDVSPGGVRLQTPRAVAAGSVLHVILGKWGTSELVLVRWVTSSADQSQIAGCSFVRALTHQEFEALYRAGAGGN